MALMEKKIEKGLLEIATPYGLAMTISRISGFRLVEG